MTWLWAGQSRVQIQGGARDFSLLQNVQTVLGANSAFYSMDNRGSFPGVQQLGHKADDSSI